MNHHDCFLMQINALAMFDGANYKYNLSLKFVFKCYNFYRNEGNIQHLGLTLIMYLRN
jgi:hypothetical protein